MRRRYLVVIFLFLVVGLWAWRFKSQLTDHIAPEASVSGTNDVRPLAAAIQRGQTKAPEAMLHSANPQENLALVDNRNNQAPSEEEKGQDDWRTAIEFYGKVIDEGTNPVTSAEIRFSCNDLSSSGTSYYQSKSDGQGLFGISGIRGKLLTVSVAKEGYYSCRADNDSFYYAGQNVNFIPDRAAPVIFHLRTKHTAEPLVHVQAAMGGGMKYRVGRDGTPVEVSLRTGEVLVSGQGDIRVQCWTDDLEKSPGKKYNWKCRIAVPNGGILAYTNEFSFEAPLLGYQSQDEIDRPANMETGWERNAKRNYFLKLGSGNYARINFEMIAGGDHFFQLESFLNPSGSRNLEYDPDVK